MCAFTRAPSCNFLVTAKHEDEFFVLIFFDELFYRVSIKFRKKLNGSHLQKKASSELIFLAKDSAICGVYEKHIKNNAFINLNCLITFIN